MDSNIKPNILVDAVITWVDGSDKDLIKKKAKYLNSEKESKIQNVKTRYNQVGEIEFVINDNGTLEMYGYPSEEISSWIENV